MRDIKGEEIWSVKEGKKRKGEYRAEKEKERKHLRQKVVLMGGYGRGEKSRKKIL